MATLETFEKQPGETDDFNISFADWLAQRGDSIQSHTVTVPSGITLESSSAINGSVRVWLSGGTDKTKYLVTAKVTTMGGRVKEGDITIWVREKR